MSSIEWTDATWNPLAGCTPVSSGCLNCYAATMANRMHGMTLAGRRIPGYDRPLTVTRDGRQVFNGTVRTLPERLTEPLRWRKPRMVFVNSMSDLFHEAVPDEFIDRVFAVMALCPRHTFQVLTKRPERMAEFLNTKSRAGFTAAAAILDGHVPADPSVGGDIPWPWPLPNVWLGTSVEDQKAADERIPHLLNCPAAVRFLSCEPLLGRVLLYMDSLFDEEAWAGRIARPRDDVAVRQRDLLHWVIVGGESGARARACDVEWIRSIVGQCRDASVPVFVKQLGAKPTILDCDYHDSGFPKGVGVGYSGTGMGDLVVRLRDRKGGDPAEWPEDLRVREMPNKEPSNGD